MKKQRYTAPCIEVICMDNTDCVMETISLPINPTPGSGGGGDAKRGFFEEEDEEDGKNMSDYSPWEN